MAIISQETWDKFTVEEKKEIIKAYQNDLKKEDISFFEGCVETFEQLFGKENLQSETIAEKCVEPIKEHFNMETQDYKWSQLSQDDRDYYQALYNAQTTRQVIKNCLESNFGEHNLKPKPKIRTWEDVKEAYPETYGNENIELFPYHEFAWDVKLIRKNIATLKIAKIIELGYGGMVTNEEWEIYPQEHGKTYYSIICNHNGKLEEKELEYEVFPVERNLITFRSLDLLKEFMSYPENVELVKQYNLM